MLLFSQKEFKVSCVINEASYKSFSNDNVGEWNLKLLGVSFGLWYWWNFESYGMLRHVDLKALWSTHETVYGLGCSGFC